MKAPLFTQLRRHHQRALWSAALWVATAGLTLDFILAQNGAEPRLRGWVLALVGCFALLVRVRQRGQLRDTARSLDAKIDSQNRLEALAEVKARHDPFADALYIETDEFLVKHPLPRPVAWQAGLVLCSGLALVSVFRFFSWQEPVQLPATVATAPESIPMAAIVDSPKPVAPPPAAALRWISPPSEATALPKETIPLVLEAESTTGLKQFALHLNLNGEPRPPIPLSEVTVAGVQTLSLTLPLDAFENRPGDVISYYVTAERIRPAELPPEPAWPVIFSPLQFVEIHAVREDLVPDPELDGEAGRALQEIQQLKLDQLRVHRDTFALDHELTPRSDPHWEGLVQGAEKGQRAVSEKTSAAITAVQSAKFSGEVSDALAGAKTESEKSADALARSDPGAATLPGGRSLTKLAAAENIMTEIVRENRARLAAEAAAQAALLAKAEEGVKLPPRERTPAGRLEKLAAEQKNIADQVAEHRATPETFAAQDRIGREIEKLAAERGLASAVNEILPTAASAAKEAARQLNEQDASAAIEPAARAAQTLAEAVEAMEAAGREQTARELEAAQLALIRAASDTRGIAADELGDRTDAAAKDTAATRESLRAAAIRQQEKGSAEGALQLADMVGAVDRSKVQAELQQLATEPKAATPEKREAVAQTLVELAQRSVDARTVVDDRAKMQAKALEELRRAQANLARAASEGSTALRNVYERALASSQILGAKVAADLPSPPSSNAAELPDEPLHWLSPATETSAAADETVALLAGTKTDAGLTKLRLHLTVNGTSRSGPAVPTNVAAGVQSIPISLSLAALKVASGDLVTYLVTAEQPTGAVSTAVQFITVDSEDQSGANGTGEGEADTRFRDFVVDLQSRQREILQRTLDLEHGMPARNDPSGPGLIRTLEAAQKALMLSIDITLNERPEIPREAFLLLAESRKEMYLAAGALGRSEPTVAAPAEIRALAALAKILNKKSKSNKGDQASAAAPPGFGGVKERAFYLYIENLSPKLEGLIQLANEALRAAKRAQMLTTGNPADAPPAYRPAVADYFESLARDPKAPTPPPPQP